MANTVNDVMNVIASPDYGIKNIAGTNQEILAILSGNHNSQNNIHAIVNDVKNILQNLVEVSTKKTLVKVGGKSPKINTKHIQNILDETRDIRKTLDNLAITIKKHGKYSNMPTVAKLSNKASEKVAKAMIKDIEKQKKGGGMAALVDAFTKLKDISLKDIIFGKLKLKKITKLFKNAKQDLNIKEKDLNAIIKLINAAPEMIKSLQKVNWRIDKVIKNKVIKKLSDILIGKKESLLALSKALQKNTKVFKSGSKSAKNIEELATSMKKAMRNIAFAALWSKLANIGIASIESMLNNIAKLSKKLTKNKKDITAASKVAKKISVFIGNLLVTSIFLTLSLVTVIPAILGALALRVLVDTLIPIGKKLSRNRKKMTKATGAAIIFTAFTGLMLISSIFLAKIAENGLSALLGSAVILGVVVISVLTFKILNKTKKNIIIGSIMMAIMSLSLLLFGVALSKITKATENVSWKQVGIIATTLIMFALATAVLGIPAVAPFIILGAISMSAMSVGLLFFGESLGKIAKATEKMKFKQVLIVAGAILLLGIATSVVGIMLPLIGLGSISLIVLSFALKPFVKTLGKIAKATQKMEFKHIFLVAGAMGILGAAVAGMALLSIPIGLGAIALGAMGSALLSFVKSLKIISEIKKIPKKEIDVLIESMEKIGDFFSDYKLSFKTTRNAKRYLRLMNPFMRIIRVFSKIKEIGENIPMKLIYQTIDAMRKIADYYKDNSIERKEIRQAKRYKKMLKPFGDTIKHLSKLKELGSIPIKLVYQTLNAIRKIADYYKDNSIERKVIRQARRYRKLLEPFGNTVGHLSKLKELGSIPIKLVYQTLNAMSKIADYYKNNPIERKVIRQARRYKRFLKPFGDTVEYLTKLKKLGSIPIKLVHQTLNAISKIAEFYQNQDMGGFFDRWDKEASAETIATIVSSFGVAAESLKTISELKRAPLDIVKNTISAIDTITWFYMTTYVSDDNLDEKSSFIEMAVDKFTNMAKNIRDKFKDMRDVDHKAIKSVARACKSIINFYAYTPFFVKDRKITRMNNALKQFSETTRYLKDNIHDFASQDVVKVKFALKAMKDIIKFLKKDSLNNKGIKKAQKNVSLLSGMAAVMLKITKIDPASVSSVGEALTTALSGVHAVDISQVDAVTNMFNAFNGINKSENLINKFADSVKDFTSACKDLMDAMEQNTDAINGIDTNDDANGGFFSRLKNKMNNLLGFGSNDDNTSSTTTNTEVDGGIRMKIANVDELSESIAKKINGTLSLDIPDTQVQLTINGTGGNEWTITKY